MTKYFEYFPIWLGKMKYYIFLKRISELKSIRSELQIASISFIATEIIAWYIYLVVVLDFLIIGDN